MAPARDGLAWAVGCAGGSVGVRVGQVAMSRRVRAVDVIAQKRDGGEIDRDQLRDFVLAYAREELPDYQMAAFLMAGYLRGFTRGETEALTEAMVTSGDRLDLSRLSGPTVDKHSTGGVADGTTLVVGPLAAALGMQVIKLSGRGLGHTGGTLDKLESIPGFRVGLAADELLDQVERIGLAVAAQTADLVPADKSIYALRDVTATVGNVALIASSVMSKKLAGGAASILLDVKTGSGAFMHETAEAVELARTCVDLGKAAGRATAALVSDMNQPLGELIGNAVEVREAVEALRGERPGRFLDLCLTLTGHMAALAGTAADPEAGRRDAQRALERGDGLERFREFVAAQGGDPRVADDLSLLPQASVTAEVEAPQDGWLAAVDAEAVGRVAAALGAGRQRKDDDIDPAVAVELSAKLGDRVESGQPVARILARDGEAARAATGGLLATLRWSDQPAEVPPLVHEVVGA
jgi:pyrimidine-nucleoside phosphorylase